MRLPSGVRTPLFVASECPSAVVWDAQGGRQWFIAAGALWTHQEGAPAEDVRREASLPAQVPVEEGRQSILWVDREGQPHIAFLFEAEKAGLTTQTVTEDGREQMYVLFDGQRLPMPESTTAYVAECAALVDGRWKLVEVAATASDFGDALGLYALRSLPRRNASGPTPRGVSLSDLIDRSTCAGKPCDRPVDAGTLRQLGMTGADAAAAELDAGHGTRVVFATSFGDTLHASAPVFLCRESCATAIRLSEVNESQIGIAVDDGILAITTEYDNADPRLYEAATGELLFRLPDARSAVFLGE
jgi:hypothetical protein